MNNLRTLLTVPSLHCSTCASFTETFIKHYIAPFPAWIHASIPQQQILLDHGQDLNVIELCNELAAVGYKVTHSKTKCIDPDMEAYVLETSDNEKIYDDALLAKSTDHLNHLDHCGACAEKVRQNGSQAFSDSALVTKTDDEALYAVEVASNEAPHGAHSAHYTVQGMNCSSCVGKISKALEAHSWVVTAEVALLSSSVRVDFTGPSQNADSLSKTIEDLGYTATLDSLEVMQLSGQFAEKWLTDRADQWQAAYSVEGMSCSSCIDKITKAIKSVSHVKSVNVSLLLASITVDFQGRTNHHAITAAIRDTGYSARLEDLRKLDTIGQGESRVAHETDAEGKLAGQTSVDKNSINLKMRPKEKSSPKIANQKKWRFLALPSFPIR